MNTFEENRNVQITVKFISYLSFFFAAVFRQVCCLQIGTVRFFSCIAYGIGT